MADIGSLVLQRRMKRVLEQRSEMTAEEARNQEYPWLIQIPKFYVPEITESMIEFIVGQLDNPPKIEFTVGMDIQACTLDQGLTEMFASSFAVYDLLNCVTIPDSPDKPLIVTFQGSDIPEALRNQPVFLDGGVRGNPLLASILVGAWLQLRYQLYYLDSEPHRYPDLDDLVSKYKYPRKGKLPSGGTVRFFKDLLPGAEVKEYFFTETAPDILRQLVSELPSGRSIGMHKTSYRHARKLELGQLNIEIDFFIHRLNPTKQRRLTPSILQISWNEVTPPPDSDTNIIAHRGLNPGLPSVTRRARQ